jgi:hypothetical protein
VEAAGAAGAEDEGAEEFYEALPYASTRIGVLLMGTVLFVDSLARH